MMQMIQVDEIQQNTQKISLDGYSAGMYFVKLKSAGLPDVTKRVMLNNTSNRLHGDFINLTSPEFYNMKGPLIFSAAFL
ncbi:MAG: hypothetical protein IPI60_05975 [Saprospiraceae bacterium]|nr:hypothetical protein [Saprospiraceae bacterium]